MSRIYATPENLAEWTGTEAPVNAASLLRHASTLVESATVNAIYPTDVDGYATGDATAVAFLEATAAQAAFWAANGLDPAGGSLAEMGKGHATSKSIKGASVGYSVTLVEANNLARQQALRGLCEEAWSILSNAGLITAAVR